MKRGLVIVAAILVTGGLVAFVASGSTTRASGPATTIQEAPPDTIPIHTTVTAGRLEIPGVRELASEGEDSVTAEAPVLKNRFALGILDGREDSDGDGSFTCVMDFDSEYEGRLESVELLSNSRWTLCFGIYANMPVSADSTIKCVRCPFSERLVCGSNPQCWD